MFKASCYPQASLLASWQNQSISLSHWSKFLLIQWGYKFLSSLFCSLFSSFPSLLPLSILLHLFELILCDWGSIVSGHQTHCIQPPMQNTHIYTQRHAYWRTSQFVDPIRFTQSTFYFNDHLKEEHSGPQIAKANS